MHETREFMPAVIELAELLGWRVYHQGGDIRKGVRSATSKGFGDLVMARERGARLIYAELKSEKGVMSPDQVAWMRCMLAVADRSQTVEAVQWRPAQWLDGTIERALR